MPVLPLHGNVGTSKVVVVSTFVFLSRLLSGTGCGIRLYWFLIIAVSFTFYSLRITEFITRFKCLKVR